MSGRLSVPIVLAAAVHVVARRRIELVERMLAVELSIVRVRDRD